ncbi:MAG: cupredoxin domain-containing protein [Longimicrobiales bacterium]
MTELEMLVLTTGVAGVGGINWWFFGPRGDAAAASEGSDGVQAVTLAVAGGYAPAVVKVKQGRPIRLTFDRQETSGCSEEVVFPDLGIRRFLPAFEQTTLDLPPQQPGVLEFTCGMSMLRGRVVFE